MALWLFVLIADTAAAGSLTVLTYVLAAVVGLAIVLAEMWLLAQRRDQLKPQPVRIRVSDYPRGRRR